ncbi:MAG: hypothetical protein ACRDNF_22720 [Streptosporangiaceae bacterium]
MYKRAIAVLTVTAVPLVITVGQMAVAASGQPAAGLGHAPHAVSTWPTGQLRPNPVQPTFATPAVTGPTVPHYSDKFSYGGKTYTYTSVGTDPKTSTATTTVPVTFIPVKILEASGAYDYPIGAIGSTTGSALFHKSVATGATQYGDATLRSSFYKYVNANSNKWHVKLGSPATTALRTVNVPGNEGSYYQISSGSTGYVMTLNEKWYANSLASIAAKYSANSLVVFLTYNAVACSNYTKVKTCGTFGFHTDTASSTGTHTFAWGSWLEKGVFGASEANTAGMSHEIAEWLNDPFVNDKVPSWTVPGEPQYGCSDLFEVGDPLVGHVFSIGGLNYQDETDFSWFARQSPSIAYQGRYDYLGTVFTTYSPTC